MAECVSNATSVHVPTIQESTKGNYFQEIRPNSPNEKNNDTMSQMSDDEYAESVVTIGEIGVDEYFDDFYCDNNLSTPAIDTRSNVEPSTSEPSTSEPSTSEPSTSEPSTNQVTDENPNDYLNALQLVVDSEHPDIAMKEELVSFEEHQRKEAMESAAIINEYLKSGKRVRKVVGENGQIKFIYSGLKLADIGITALPRFLWINEMDENIMSTNRLLLRLPTYYSASNVLQSFTVKKKMSSKTLTLMMEAFNTILPLWCLHQIEKLQYENLKEKYPDKKLCEIYGVVHLVRFSTYIPYLLRAMGPFAWRYHDALVIYMNNFMDFLEEANILIDQDDFYHVMPDYHRMTFKSGPSKYLYKAEKFEDVDEYYEV